MAQMNDFTRILNSLAEGREQASEDLLPLVYDELRRLAAAKMAREQPGQTLQPTGLVHEAFVRLVGTDASWQDRAHFLAAASRQMRLILVDRARARLSQKRGGRQIRVSLGPQRGRVVTKGLEAEDEVCLAEPEARP